MANRWTLTDDGIRLAGLMVHSWNRYERLCFLALSYAEERDDEHFRYVSARMAGDLLPFDKRHAHWAFKELVRQEVLEVRAAAGSRPAGYRPEGDVTRWAVKWGDGGRRDADHVRLQLEVLGVIVSAPQIPGSRRGIARQKRFVVPRSGAALGRFVSRQSAAQTDALCRDPARRNAPSSSGLSTEPGRRQTAREVEEEAWATLHGDEARTTWLRLVIARITGRGSGPVRGELVRRLAVLAGQVPLDVAEKVITGQHESQRPPAVVEALEVFAWSGGAPPGPGRRRRPALQIHDPGNPGAGTWVETFDTEEEAMAAANAMREEGLDVVEA